MGESNIYDRIESIENVEGFPIFIILGKDSSNQRGLFILEIETDTNNLAQVKVIDSEFRDNSFTFEDEFKANFFRYFPGVNTFAGLLQDGT